MDKAQAARNAKVKVLFDKSVTPNAGAMTRAEAIDLMKTSKNMVEWNLNRETVKRSVGVRAFIHCGYVGDIDASGLVVQTLGKDSASATKAERIYKPFKRPNA